MRKHPAGLLNTLKTVPACNVPCASHHYLIHSCGAACCDWADDGIAYHLLACMVLQQARQRSFGCINTKADQHVDQDAEGSVEELRWLENVL